MPGVTAYLLVIFIAAWAIIGGILRIIAAINLRKEIEGEWYLALGGAVSILLGVLLMVVPSAGVLSLGWLIGIWAMVFGALFVMLAFRLRKASKMRAGTMASSVSTRSTSKAKRTLFSFRKSTIIFWKMLSDMFRFYQ